MDAINVVVLPSVLTTDRAMGEDGSRGTAKADAVKQTSKNTNTVAKYDLMERRSAMTEIGNKIW